MVKAWIICALVVVCVTVQESSAGWRNSRGASNGAKGQQDKEQNKEPAWQPVTGTREFTVNVDDHIKGANQHRHEKWDNGTVVGSYAAPGRDGKWLKVEYAADKNGFRITNTKEINAEELMSGQPGAKDHTAHIGIQTDDNAPVDYTVTEDQLKKSNNKENQQKEKSKTQQQ